MSSEERLARLERWARYALARIVQHESQLNYINRNESCDWCGLYMRKGCDGPYCNNEHCVKKELEAFINEEDTIANGAPTSESK